MIENECKGITFKARVNNYISRSGKRSSYAQTVVVALVRRKLCMCADCAELVTNFYKHIEDTKANVMPDPVKHCELYKLVYEQGVYGFQPVIEVIKTPKAELTDMTEKEENTAMDQMSEERGPTKDFRP